ncbi:hypothetical protein OJ996_22045 [Luteolibacter sp. GHJ8]|uniref:Uncharacterized protein n=1 Tax=Luteolibacter rhizosphaerae TaxID=2989719 RepID=A0ABT3G8W4_9BACT|nr:hypothetical protein [Luteolibacter rhizosphaerae]MCW1916287.1 hypothetical protein [Luteolibacter rhizosphaerae]
MKKKRALLLFATLALLVGGYAAWCGRIFYLHVPTPEMTELPEEYRADARALIKQHGLTDPEPFETKRFLELLAQPYDSDPEPVIIGPWTGPENVSASRMRVPFRYTNRQIVFWSTGIGWTAMVTDYVPGSETIERRRLRKAGDAAP